MNPETTEYPYPITGDIELPDGNIVRAADVHELVQLLTSVMRRRHMCISKGHLQELTSQLLVRNRLLEKELAEAQATIAKLQSPMHTINIVNNEGQPKMTSEEMAEFQRLLADTKLPPDTFGMPARVQNPDGSTEITVMPIMTHGTSLSRGYLPDPAPVVGTSLATGAKSHIDLRRT